MAALAWALLLHAGSGACGGVPLAPACGTADECHLQTVHEECQQVHTGRSTSFRCYCSNGLPRMCSDVCRLRGDRGDAHECSSLCPGYVACAASATQSPAQPDLTEQPLGTWTVIAVVAVALAVVAVIVLLLLYQLRKESFTSCVGRPGLVSTGGCQLLAFLSGKERTKPKQGGEQEELVHQETGLPGEERRGGGCQGGAGDSASSRRPAAAEQQAPAAGSEV